jgi:hypothetical protein
MVSSIVFATHQLRPANPFPPFRFWQLTRLGQVNLRCGSPQFQHSSRLSSTCLLTHPANSDPVRVSLSLTHLESILAKVYQNKQLKPHLELYTYEKHGGGVFMANQPADSQLGSPVKSPPTRPSHCSGRLWVQQWAPKEIFAILRETTPLYPVSNKSERTSVTATVRRRLRFASRAWVHRSNGRPQQGGPNQHPSN